MRVVVASGDDERRARLVHMLTSDQRCAIGIDHEGLEAEIHREVPEILVVDVPSAGGPDLIRRACVADQSRAMYVISVVGEHLPPRTSISVVAAGSHNVLRAPFTAADLCVQVDVHRRLRGWLAGRTPAVKPTSPGLIELRAWDYLGDIIGDDLEAMLGRPLEIAARWLPMTDSTQHATIAMSLPTDQVELCVSIVADTQTRTWLGQALLGDPDAPDDALDDVMRELANVAGGALKRAALVEGPVLSTGIPVDGRSLPRRDSGARCWSIPLEGDAAIGVIGEVRRRANRRIPARRLCEGMIVVGDVCNGSGILLLPAGTRLTSTTAERLSGLLDYTLVEVTAA